jgi:hypothetical protein
MPGNAQHFDKTQVLSTNVIARPMPNLENPNAGPHQTFAGIRPQMRISDLQKKADKRPLWATEGLSKRSNGPAPTFQGNFFAHLDKTQMRNDAIIQPHIEGLAKFNPPTSPPPPELMNRQSHPTGQMPPHSPAPMGVSAKVNALN